MGTGGQEPGGSRLGAGLRPVVPDARWGSAAAVGRTLCVRLLGPVEVVVDGRPVALGSAKSQALVGRLALTPNQVVTSETLLEDLWPGQRPDQGEVALRSLVFRVRRRIRAAGLDREVIATRSAGYLLAVGAGELDRELFEQGVTTARSAAASGATATASEQLAAVLELWRGPAFGDLAAEPFARTEAARLEELRLTATEDRIELDLGQGRHRDLIGELEAMTAAHPLRERLWAQRMRALYAAGRQAEALQAYRDLHRVLSDELGLTPGPELVRLEQQILRHGPEVAPAPTRTAAPSTPVSADRLAVPPGGWVDDIDASEGFAGRDGELHRLRAWFHDTASRPGSVALVCGDAGVGKTRLVAELAQQLRADGVLVLWGQCDEEPLAAYHPFVEILRQYLGGRLTESAREELGWRLPELARLLPELSPEAAGPPPVTEAETGRYRFFEAVATLLVDVAQRSRTLLVFDDMHWADRPTVLLLRHLLRVGRLAGCTVLLVSRDVELPVGHPVADLFVDLSRQGSVTKILLQGLDASAVHAMLGTQVDPAAAATLAAELHTVTEGNPLFVTELVQHLRALDLLSTEQAIAHLPVDLTLPDTLKELIASRVSRLSEPAFRLLTVGAVAGREFDAAVCGRVAELDANALLTALEEAVAARVLREAPGPGERFAFSHPLIRQALYERLLGTRRTRLHARIAQELEQAAEPGVEPAVEDLALHYLRAGSAGDWRLAVRYATAAGDRAQGQLAFEEAAGHYARALAAMPHVREVDPRDRADLLIGLAEAQNRSGDVAGALQNFEAAAAVARDLHDRRRLARAAVREGPLTYIAVVDERPADVAALEEALGVLDDQDADLRCSVASRLALHLVYTGDFDRAEQLTRDAVQTARQLGDDRVLGVALNSRLHALWGPEHGEERLAGSEELVRAASAAGDSPLAVHGCMWQVRELLVRGDVAAAEASLAVFRDLAEETRHPLFASHLRHHEAVLRLVNGETAEGERLASEALALGQPHNPLALSLYGAQMLWTWWQRGVLPAMEDSLSALLEQAPAVFPIVRCVLALLLAETGRPEVARTHVERLGADGFEAVAGDPSAGMPFALLTQVAAAVDCGPLTGMLYERLRPYAGTVLVTRAPAAACLGPADHYLGVLAATLGDLGAALVHLDRAVALAERMPAPPFVAQSAAELGRLLLRSPATRERGELMLSRAALSAAACGLQRIQTLVESAGG